MSQDIFLKEVKSSGTHVEIKSEGPVPISFKSIKDEPREETSTAHIRVRLL
jgi:hypothetical protein